MLQLIVFMLIKFFTVEPKKVYRPKEVNARVAFIMPSNPYIDRKHHLPQKVKPRYTHRDYINYTRAVREADELLKRIATG